MISFPLRRVRWSPTIRLTVKFTFLLPLLLLKSLPGQTSGELFRGTWQVETPDDGSLILILKRNQLASYFWGDNADRTVYQGSWSLTEDGNALATWPDGSSHLIRRDNLGFGISALDAAGQTRYSTPAEQVPQEILGQWAKPPSRGEELASDRDEAKGFFGIWRIGEGADRHYVVVEPDRSAASTWSARESTSRGLRGAWAKQGSELHVAWDSGHYSIFTENPRGFTYKRIEPAANIEDGETEAVPATRVDQSNLPPAWFAQYEDEKGLSSGGIAFSSRKVARSFYRGNWVVPKSGDRFEQIEIGRFGGLSTSADRSLGGSWLMSGQDVFLRWDDGMREVLSPVGWGFVIYEYQPGRPLDGVPTRIYPAAPADADKLAEHLKDRAEVAKQMLAMAEAAGINPQSGSAGWGRTFMRWAWPFGEGDTAGEDASAQEMLEAEYETAPGSDDPWWWPFWSEREVARSAEPAPEPETEEVETGSANADSGEAVETVEIKAELDAAAQSETIEVADNESEAPEPTPDAEAKSERLKAPSADGQSGWVWPF